jgi:CheY-like chemotaxis protein
MKEKIILLVEDNLSDIDLARRALQKAHITNELVVAESGEEALDYLFGKGAYKGRDARQMPALVLLDLKLPGVDGVEVIRRVRKHAVTMRQPVVVMSSSREERDIIQCYDSGANSYIRKPVDFLQFVDAIQQLGTYWLALNEMPPAGGIAQDDPAKFAPH